LFKFAPENIKNREYVERVIFSEIKKTFVYAYIACCRNNIYAIALLLFIACYAIFRRKRVANVMILFCHQRMELCSTIYQ